MKNGEARLAGLQVRVELLVKIFAGRSGLLGSPATSAAAAAARGSTALGATTEGLVDATASTEN